MSKTTVIVNPGFVVRTPGYRFTEGQAVTLDAHQASRLIASGDVRLDDGAKAPKAKAKPKAEPAAEEADAPGETEDGGA